MMMIHLLKNQLHQKVFIFQSIKTSLIFFSLAPVTPVAKSSVATPSKKKESSSDSSSDDDKKKKPTVAPTKSLSTSTPVQQSTKKPVAPSSSSSDSDDDKPAKKPVASKGNYFGFYRLEMIVCVHSSFCNTSC